MEITLEATNRDKTGSAESRRLRSTGFIPAVMYGLGSEPESLLINAKDFSNALKTEAGSNVILNVNFGKQSIPALAREIQRHAFKDEIVHVDLIRIDLSQTVEADVQINFLGTPLGVKEEGGVIQTVNNTISITALPTSIPSSIDIDISELNVGDNVTATDINLPDGVTLTSEDDESILVTITIPRAAVEEEALGEDFEGEDGEEEAGEGDQESGDGSTEDSESSEESGE
jgi:large subunit ribosomal protein L25